jgi:hypothetical protein
MFYIKYTSMTENQTESREFEENIEIPKKTKYEQVKIWRRNNPDKIKQYNKKYVGDVNSKKEKISQLEIDNNYYIQENEKLKKENEKLKNGINNLRELLNPESININSIIYIKKKD